jgi:hypothetical protein
MSTADNDSYMIEMSRSAATNNNLSDYETNDSDFAIPGGHIQGHNKSPNFICGQNTCLNGGTCDPITQKCKCKGHHTGNFKDQLECVSNASRISMVIFFLQHPLLISARKLDHFIIQ